MRRDDLADLTAFLAVAEARSFTRAAARLGQSQSSLSQIVRRLEERLGLRLLTRTTRSVAVTEAGRQLLETLRPAIDEVEARLVALSALRQTPSGRLRITTGRHAVETVLWPALERLARTCPEVEVEVSVDPALRDIVAEGFDAGIRLGEQVAQDMIAVRIGAELRMAVVGAPCYFERHPRPATPHALTRHRCINIRLPTAGGLYPWEFGKDGRTLNVRVEGPLIFNDMPLVLKAATTGLGLAMVFEDQATALIAEGRLERVLADWCPPFPGYHLYYPDRRLPSPAFAALLAALRRQPTADQAG
ncbi:LysR family transcriptional regulator [Roseomonas sp. 18066]|uniref:LysR family transcriptional regulator n=1 Tax=Roseomonas sp. 18066 TaxID=2681412 RepID=UPI00135B8767|nr:LysR family transcriptional regulator [Roseomonas sp. 18066]